MKRKNRIRILSVLLIVCLFCSYLPASAIAVGQEETPAEAPREITLSDVIAGVATIEDLYGKLDESVVPDAIGYDEAVKKQHVARLYEEEGNDLNKVIFLNADGSKTMYTFDHPVKYQTAAGEIQDISLEIADSLSSNAAFVSASADAVTTFSANLSDGISLSGNGVQIGLIPLLPTASSGNNMAQTGSMGATSGNLTLHTATRLDEKTVSYYYDDKTTIEYSLTYTGFKEDIVVSEYTGQTEYSFLLNTGGYALKKIGGSYFLVDDAGNIKATIGDIIIFTADERNNTLGQIVPTTIREKEQYLLTIVIDEDYLADENTAYPIRIDPTVEITYALSGADKIEDVTVYTADTTTPNLYSIFVGNKQNGGIARILMKFPGLDLSDLGENVYIESASVSIRDLLCEATPLDVSCYVYCGGSWSEKINGQYNYGINWSNTIEANNTYLSTYLDTQTISYSNGTVLSEQHRYSFDITEAVQGWYNGNYDQYKGIIFKADDSVENGSTYNWKTLSSYNRGSYEPRFIITYTPSVSQLVANDLYYLNNEGTGKYLRYSTDSAMGQSGRLSALGNSVRWDIIKNSNGEGYLIRSLLDSTKYLSVPARNPSTEVTIETINNAEIPRRCIWNISLAAGGGCLIKNVYSGRYVYSNGTTLYTAVDTPNYETDSYNKYVWRLKSVSSYQEMTAGTTIATLMLSPGQSASVSVQCAQSDELWVYPYDFTYEIIVPELLTESNSIFTAAYAHGLSTVIATHKVTERKIIFAVVIGEQPTLKVNHYVDQGYQVRFGTAAGITEYNAVVRGKFAQIFGLNETFTIINFTSVADDCKIRQFGSVTSSNLTASCPHLIKHLNTTIMRNDLSNGLDNGDNTTTNVLWTGHILDGNPRSNSNSFSHTVVMTPYKVVYGGSYNNKPADEIKTESIKTLIHELSHQIGAPDHYCYEDYKYGLCSNGNCDVCVHGMDTPRTCLMSGNVSVEGSNLANLYCSDCLRTINLHLIGHHQPEE